MLDPSLEEREPSGPGRGRVAERALELEGAPQRPTPAPHAPVPQRTGRTPRESTEGQGSSGKYVLWGLALLLVLVKGCDGCEGRNSLDPRQRRPGPTRPTETPTRSLEPLTLTEQRRLDQLRRDHTSGEPLTPAEGRELLELERRASATRRPGR